MNWGNWALAVLIASVLASFSDWLFMGVLFHDRYFDSPEIWRSPGRTEPRTIVYSQLLGVLSCAAFATLCQADALTIPASLTAAALVWLAGPVVVIAQMMLWMKLHPLVGASHKRTIRRLHRDKQRRAPSRLTQA
jgi:heme exporter protein D